MEKQELVQRLLEAGAHFGHQTKRWNPKMKKFIYTEKNGIHIIDASQTAEKLEKALEFVRTAAAKGDVIFVGTKKQAQNIIRDAAMKAGSYFIINRWPGGMLTNHSIIRLSLNKIDDILKGFEQGIENRTKKELILTKRELVRLDRLYGGLRGFNRKPAAVFVVDAKTESIAVREARKMNVPIVGMVDTNTDPDLVDYIIPSNDDSIKSIELISNLIAEAVLDGNKGKGVQHNPIDLGKIDLDIAQMSTKVAELKSVDVQPEVKVEEKTKVVRVKAPTTPRKDEEPVKEVKEKKVVRVKAAPKAEVKETKTTKTAAKPAVKRTTKAKAAK